MAMAMARREPNYYIAGFANGSDPSHLEVYPRVGGGTLCMTNPRPTVRGLSPRGPTVSSNGPDWSIPAWAGEPR